MARSIHKLSARTVATLRTPGRHSDGGGLYLVVEKGGARRWVFLYRWKANALPGPGRLREMGLGSLLNVSLPEAREAAAAARKNLAARVDPISAKRIARGVPTFGELADDHIKTKTETGNADKSIARLKRSLEVYAAKLRPLSVDLINTDAVLEILRPIWTEKPETSQKVRGHVEAVLDAAKARGFRSGDNPARWKGHLDHLLARHGRKTAGHHDAMPFKALPKFFSRLREKGGMGARTLQFTILTAARSGEAFGATWAEIDLDAKVWTVPAGRMKEGREHRVPLTDATVKLLRERAGDATPEPGELVFPGVGGVQQSPMTMTKVLRDMGETATVHGFRSSFRDWVGDATTFDRLLAEAALAHAVGDQAERAYRRGDALERRREVMQSWAVFCGSEAA